MMIETTKTRGAVSNLVSHDKCLSLLKGYKCLLVRKNDS